MILEEQRAEGPVGVPTAEPLCLFWDASHRFDDRLGAFVQDLRSLLLETSPEGLCTVALSQNRLRIRRPSP